MAQKIGSVLAVVNILIFAVMVTRSIHAGARMEGMKGEVVTCSGSWSLIKMLGLGDLRPFKSSVHFV